MIKDIAHHLSHGVEDASRHVRIPQSGTCDVAALRALQIEEEGFEVVGAKWLDDMIDATSGSNSGSGLGPTGVRMSSVINSRKVVMTVWSC